jgi:hypothetical protein
MRSCRKRHAWIAAGCALSLGAGFALAEPGSDGAVRTSSLQVLERLTSLERIHVTAEKPANPDADPLSASLAELLEEAAKLEAEERLASPD